MSTDKIDIRYYSILANYLYHTKNPNELTQEQKDTITNILSLATTATIYTATNGDVASGVNAAEVGRVGVEDNDFSWLATNFNTNNSDFNQGIIKMEYCQSNPSTKECQPKVDPMQPVKDAIPKLPKGAISVGANAHIEALGAFALEGGIVLTNNNNSGFPDAGVYYTYSGGAGVGGAGVGANFSAYSEGRSNFDGSSKSINPCSPFVCASAHFNDDGKVIGGSMSGGTNIPSASATINETHSIMFEDIFEVAGYVSDHMKDGGMKRQKQKEQERIRKTNER